MFMGEEESVADFAGKLSKVATQLRSLGEKIDDGVLVAKLLRAAPAKFDAITSSIEQFGDMDSMSLEEAIGSAIGKLGERSNFFSLKPRENKRNMNKVTLVEEVEAADGEEDEEEVEVMENNTSIEMKRGLETSQR